MTKRISFFLFFGLLFFIVFKSLLLNITTNLIDWRDYAYVTWVINQNINHLISYDFQNLFNQNAFYPFKNTLFLSDTLLTQSLLGLPIRLLTSNPITVFNLIFIITFALNYVSSFILWSKIFKKDLIAFVGSVVLVFSPFFYTQIGHFQMQSYWPLLLSIFFLIQKSKNKYYINYLLVGFFLSLQFLASVYLAFFGFIIISLFLFFQKFKGQNYGVVVTKFSLIIITFLILDGIFVKGYIDTHRNFAIKRSASEYLVYSAKITDYFFPRQTGIFYQNPIIRKWQSYNSHNFGEPASFPGFVLGTLAILGLVKFKNTKSDFSLHFSSKLFDLFILVLILIGFLFSLGLPYLPLAKYVPLFDTTRGTSRWSFLVYIGIIYFAISFLSKIKTKWVLALLALLFLDVLPSNITTHSESYITNNDSVLKSICTQNKTVVLEIPVTHFDAGNNIAEGLSYITKRELASLYNKCLLINGYSGYDLPSIQKIKDDLILADQTSDTENFYMTVKETGANAISVNFDDAPSILYPNLKFTLDQLTKLKKFEQISGAVYLIK